MEIFGQLDVKSSIRDVYIGWLVGDEWREKVTVRWQGTSEAQKPAWERCAGSLMAEMKAKYTLWTFGLLKQAATLDIASPDTGQCLKPPFEPFTSPCTNSPLLQSTLSRQTKFRLEANSTMVWLYASSVGSILPDVQFGMVSQDWVTILLITNVYTMKSCSL